MDFYDVLERVLILLQDHELHESMELSVRLLSTPRRELNASGGAAVAMSFSLRGHRFWIV